MKAQKVKKITITTVNGEEYSFFGCEAADLFAAYKGAVESRADWIYSEDDATTSVFQIRHIVNIFVIKEGEGK